MPTAGEWMENAVLGVVNLGFSIFTIWICTILAALEFLKQTVGLTTKIRAPRVIVITGGSSGIGAAMALELSKPGVHLFLIARNQQRLAEVANACRQRGATFVETRSIDLGELSAKVRHQKSHNELEIYLYEIDDRYGGLDLVIANAGITSYDVGRERGTNVVRERRGDAGGDGLGGPTASQIKRAVKRMVQGTEDHDGNGSGNGSADVRGSRRGDNREPDQDELTLADMSQRLFDVNVQGVMEVISPSYAIMKQRRRGGRIAIMSSLAALFGAPQLAMYSATKAALFSFARDSASMFEKSNIQLSVICPGFVTSRMTDAMRYKGASPIPNFLMLDTFSGAKTIVNGLLPGWFNRRTVPGETNLRTGKFWVAFPFVMEAGEYGCGALPPTLQKLVSDMVGKLNVFGNKQS